MLRRTPTFRAGRHASAALGAALLLVLPQAAMHVFAPRGPAAAVSRELLTWRVNPNLASTAELSLLPGIGPTLAARIVERRSAASTPPAFARLEDLDRVQGIGPAKLELLRECVALPRDDAAGHGERP